MSYQRFKNAYVEALLWSSLDTDENGGEVRFDEGDELSTEALAEIESDCRGFYDEHHELFEDDEQAGHDFALTRNRHGAGFWDRGLGEVGETLTKASHGYGEMNLYFGDDGLIYTTT